MHRGGEGGGQEGANLKTGTWLPAVSRPKLGPCGWRKWHFVAHGYRGVSMRRAFRSGEASIVIANGMHAYLCMQDGVAMRSVFMAAPGGGAPGPPGSHLPARRSLLEAEDGHTAFGAVL